MVYAGGQANPEFSGYPPVAPSTVQARQFPTIPEETGAGKIRNIVAAFGQAARRAMAWGFDAVQLHCAHGYLINQFLSA